MKSKNDLLEFIKSCSDSLLSELSQKETLELKNYKEEDLLTLHFSLGVSIRNKYIFKNEDIKDLFFQPDNISMEIIRSAWYTLNNTEYEDKGLILPYGIN